MPTPTFLDKLNAKASPNARLRWAGDHPFGRDRVMRYELGNGLTVLLLVDRSAPVVSYATWYRVGSRHEKPGKTGLAHFFEHLMFNETEHLKAGEFDRKLEESGAESNAATWLDWTYYYEALPADRVGLAIKLEADRMSHLVLREPQVESEREVVSNERRMRVDDDPDGIANELLYKLAYTKHSYHWPTIGWMEDIKAYTPADCEAFYRAFYAPNNATVVIVGDIKPQSVLAKLQKAYGEIPSSVVPPEDIAPEPPQLEPRSVEVVKPTTNEKVFIGYMGPSLGDHDHTPLNVLAEIMSGGRASRLYTKLVTEKEIATEPRCWAATFRDPGIFEITAAARDGHTARELEQVIVSEIDKLSTELVTDEELERAKARLELSQVQSLETASGKAEQIGFYETVLGEPSAAFIRLEATRKVKKEDIRRVARRYLVERARNTVYLLPEAP